MWIYCKKILIFFKSRRVRTDGGVMAEQIANIFRSKGSIVLQFCADVS